MIHRRTVLQCALLACMLAPLPQLAAAAPDAQSAKHHGHAKRAEVVAYIRTWAMPDGRFWRAKDIDGKAITQLNLAFASIRPDGTVFIRDLEPQPPGPDGVTPPVFKTLWHEVAKLQRKHPHLKINLSVGGWGAEGFSDMAMTAEGRARFIGSLLALVERHQLSGVGIEWQYPVGPDWGLPIKTDPKDRDNYPLLLEETRAALDRLSARTGRKYQLTAAVPSGPWFVQKNDLQRTVKSVDYLTVTAYGAYGSWSATTGHFSNLFQRTDDPAFGGWSADQSMRVYLDAGVAPNKLLMGVPFYGAAWREVNSAQNGLFQPFAAGAANASPTWDDVKAQFLDEDGFVRHWDDTAKVPWLYNGDVMVSYEDPESLRHKVKYLKEQRLGGLTVWEYAHDLKGELLDEINDALRD
ncbi:glycoside hydrolase family 18 protein [Chitiniphilus purpureus]|uniref:chitinase n=1 Tax=Chitiniphilus purpureus TaxID=2981137 RepID=A0ABY6DL47_9NEIS|nr:glycoside hydrolase family 18 protein [Chitiniphilus sp. CD1]UXY15069.1 glycoside hydrolase family 18 protein [Chitiniphilus sp. CD1]